MRYGIPAALTSLPQNISLQLDQLLIVAFLPARSLGLYAVAVSWSGATAPSLSAVGSVLFPHVSAARDPARQGRLLATALQSGVLVAVATTVPFMLLAPVGLPLLFGRAFAPAIPSALLLVPAGAILAWAGIAEQGLLWTRAPEGRPLGRGGGRGGHCRHAAAPSPHQRDLWRCRGISSRLLDIRCFRCRCDQPVDASAGPHARHPDAVDRDVPHGQERQPRSGTASEVSSGATPSPGRSGPPGRHRPPGRSGPPGRHRVVGSKAPAGQGARPS